MADQDDDQPSGPTLAPGPGGDNSNFPGQSQLIGRATLTRRNPATGEETPVLSKPLYGRPIPKSQF